MRRFSQTAACLMALFAPGCGGGAVEEDEPVPLGQVPPGAMKAAKAKLPQVDFERAWKVKEGDREAYEVRGRTKDGKTRDAKVTASGDVLEVD